MGTAPIRGPRIRGFVDTRRLSAKGHTIERWHRLAVQEVKLKAQDNAPVNKDPRKAQRQGVPVGFLKANISFRTRGRTATNSHTGSVVATAPYALYVHEGTNTPILPRNGPFLRVPAGSLAAGRRDAILTGSQDATNPLRRVISPGNRPWMLRGSKAQHRGDLLVRSVRGQKPQPFLRDALEFVATRRRWRSSRVSTSAGLRQAFGGD